MMPIVMLGFAMTARGATPGQALYHAHCESCHGSAGQGNGPGRPNKPTLLEPLSGAPRSGIERAILAPDPSNPGHGVAALLTPKQVAQLIAAVQALGNASSTSKTQP